MGIEELTKLANQGVCKAQVELANIYYDGKLIEQNYKEAVRYFRLAADQGDADAQFKLALCYEFGDGVEQSFKEAVRYFRLAADQGNADAQFEGSSLMVRKVVWIKD